MDLLPATTKPGLEPGLSGSGGRRFIHQPAGVMPASVHVGIFYSESN